MDAVVKVVFVIGAKVEGDRLLVNDGGIDEVGNRPAASLTRLCTSAKLWAFGTLRRPNNLPTRDAMCWCSRRARKAS